MVDSPRMQMSVGSRSKVSRDTTLTSPYVMRRLPGQLRRAIRGHRFALAAFLIPLGIRAVPEIIVGPYPVGFDTIAFYVPNTMDWAAGKVGLLEMLGTAPLMYMMVGLVLFRPGLGKTGSPWV